MKKRSTAHDKYKGVLIEKCPICWKGKVMVSEPTGFFKFLKSKQNACNECHAIFRENDTKDGESAYLLDLSHSIKKNKYNKQVLKLSEWRRGISDLDFCIKNNSLPKTEVVGLKTILQPNEQSHYYADTKLFEERATRHYVSGHSGIRLMKGVYVGGSKGYSEARTQLKEIDRGHLLLTNKQLIFNGNLRNIEYKLDKISSIEEFKDAIEIGASNKQKVQVFIVNEPKKWMTYIKIAIKKLK